MGGPIYKPLEELLRILRKTKSEALAHAFVSGFCINDGRGMWGGLMGHGRIFLSVDLARSQLFFVKLWDGGSPFRFVTSGVPTKEAFPSIANRKSEGTSQSMVKNWGLVAWQAQYAVYTSSF